MRRGVKYQTRPETADTRDPQPQDDIQTVRLAIVCVPEGQTLCPKCKCPRSRIANTKKYPEAVSPVVIRYRDCVRCGSHFASRGAL